VACPHHTNNKVRKEKQRPKKAMKTGNTLSLPVLFSKESICLVSLCPLQITKLLLQTKREVFGPCLGRQGYYCV
jgi:hypothetical protein